MDLRKYKRYQVDFPIYFFSDGFSDNTPIGTGRVFNVCEHGCKVKSDTSVATGETVAVRLYDPRLHPPVQIHSAKIIWAMELDLGLEFLTMQQGDRDRFRQFLQVLEQTMYHQSEASSW